MLSENNRVVYSVVSGRSCWLRYKLLNSLWRAVGFHGVPVHEVWSVGVDEGTEGLAVTPGAGHVGHGDPGGGVGGQDQPAPLLQGLASWHPHDDVTRAGDDPLCVLSSHWTEVTALTSGPIGGQNFVMRSNQRPESILLSTFSCSPEAK